jgi:diguanylate cyclase (GGDEF)-like protein
MIAALADCARIMLTDLPVQEVLDRLVEQVVEVLAVDAAGVTLVLNHGVATHRTASSDDSAVHYQQLQTQLGEGPGLLAIQTGMAVHSSNLVLDDRFPHFAPPASAAGLAAVSTFPLRHGALPLGALELYRGTSGPLRGGEVLAAQTLADVAAAYLVDAAARTDLQRRSLRTAPAALHDELTGLPNRALLLDRLDRALLRSRRSPHRPAVFVIDVDDLIQLDDADGRRGDHRLPVAIGQRLRRLLRPHDTVARLDGEAQSILVRLEAALTAPFRLGERTVNITVSIGLATGEARRHSADALLRAASLSR